LQKFANGETNILIGTQMVAKGLDFNRVTLVGVINADIQLLLPDFRAAERTFQLLSQVAGRAGRSRQFKGDVIIQTSQTSAYSIEAVQKKDYSNFFDIELKKRFSAQFPPFVRYCVIEFSSKNEEILYKKANEFHSILQQIVNNFPNKNTKSNSNGIIFYSPQPPPIAKINDRFRSQISVKCLKTVDLQGKYLRTVLRNALAIYSKKFAVATVNITVDVDSYAG
jgi:primosomal protein N' (replication factor Y)